MSVTVKQAMGLEVMATARIAAGRAGLDRVIRRVSFIDAPINPEVIEEKNILLPGDFFISSFFVVKDNPEQMLEIMRILLASNASGLCIISKLLIELPSKIIDFANEQDFPIIFINQDAPYGDIIRDVFVLILHDKEETLIELTLNGLMEFSYDEESVKKAVLSINNNFSKYILAIYCRYSSIESAKLIFLKDTINNVKEWACLKFRGNVLIILTFNEPDEDNISLKIKYVTDQLKMIGAKFVAGIGNLHTKLGQANKAIIEALVSSESKSIRDQDVVYYRNLGSYKFLVPLRDRPELKEFHDEIIGPIVEYDTKYKQNLLDTAVCLIACDGDFSRTAKKMFLHTNSIRYRINKIMDILNMRNKNLPFYEQLSIAIKIHRILPETESEPPSAVQE